MNYTKKNFKIGNQYAASFITGEANIGSWEKIVDAASRYLLTKDANLLEDVEFIYKNSELRPWSAVRSSWESLLEEIEAVEIKNNDQCLSVPMTVQEAILHIVKLAISPEKTVITLP